MYMTRPKRRANKNVCIAIMQGTDPDGIVAPLGYVALNKPVTRIIIPDTYIFKF